MGLRVGLVVPNNWTPEAGGGWTFTEAILKALPGVPTAHRFLILDLDSGGTGGQHCKIAPPAQPGLLSQAAALGSGFFMKRSRKDSEVDSSGLPPPSLEELARRQGADVVWFLTPMGEPLPLPYIATVWDLEHRKQPCFPEVSITGWTWEMRERLYSSLLPRASMIITGTHAGKEEVAHYYRINPAIVAVIPFPAPAPLIAPADAAAIKAKYGIDGNFLFYPAQFWPHKNHINLLHAMRILTDKSGLDLCLVLTGSDKGNLPHVLKAAGELGLSDRLLTLGFVPREDLCALYKASMALVFPSYFGPDNFPPLEAFALGVPVIAAAVKGAKEQLGQAALLFDPSDPADMATKITSVCRNPALREQMIAQGREIAKERSPEAYAAALCSHLDKFEAIRRCWGSDYRHA